MDVEPDYAIDEKDLIIDGEKFVEGDFLKRSIEHYPTRSLPLDEEKLLVDPEEELDVKSMRVVSFLKNLNLGRHYRMWPSWKKKVRFDVALDSSLIYHIPLLRLRPSTDLDLRKRKPRNPVILKLWVGKSRQLISVEFFPGDTRVDDICDSLEYVRGYWDCKDITLEHFNPRKTDKFMDNVLSTICDLYTTPKNLEHLLVYNLSRPDNSLTKASGRWRYRFCNMFVNITNKITRFPQILKVRVLETKWIQTLDPGMKKAITPCRQDLKLIMSTPTSNHPGRACFRCPYITNLNKIDLRTFPIASLAWFALIHHNFRKGAKRLFFVAVEKATVQEVAGDIVHIYISAKDDQDQVKVYKTEALLIGWLKSFELSPLTEVPSTEVVSPGGSEPVTQCCCKPKGKIA